MAGVSIESNPAPSPAVRVQETFPPDAASFAALLSRCAMHLEQEADALARRWEEQSRSLEMREAASALPDRAPTGSALVRAAAGALLSDATTSEDAVSSGFAYGADAFVRGISLHHMLRGLDLLEAMALFALERELAAPDAMVGGTAAGIRVARRLRRFFSLAVMAAAKGHTQAVADEMRDRFRHLRHDLRNPLGTIKSVLTLMDDESVPMDARAHPRFRTMASRNARALDDLIGARLSDAQALRASMTQQSVSLRAIACAVRRELRAEADARGVTITVDPDAGRVRVDAVALELMLHEVLHAALRESEEGGELHVAFGPVDRGQVAVRVEAADRPEPIRDTHVLSQLGALAARLGGSFHQTGTVTLQLPGLHVSDAEVATSLRVEDAGDVEGAALRRGKSGDDLGSPGEGEDGQPRVE